MTRYFSLDHLRSSEQSFVTSCETDDEVQELQETCCDHIIKEISHEDFVRMTSP